MAKKKAAPKPSKLLADALKLFGPNGEKWTKGEEEIELGENDKYPDGAYCSIGAMHHINTPNEDAATEILAFAIKLDTKDFGEIAEDTIVNNNDCDATTFKDVKRWFTNAIKIAKANGM